MKLNTNIPSLKVLNSMSKNDTRLEKSLERLSSGYKINKASDDATGLAISRKMQVQIDALSKANENASDGISLLQTAEGALNEVHSILQRIRELAVQSANGSLSNDDRASIESETDMLLEEINRISSTTQFNSMNLLDGSINCKTYSNNEDIAKVINTFDGVSAGTYTFDVSKAATKTTVLGTPISSAILDAEGKLAISGKMFIDGVEVNLEVGMTEEEAIGTIRDAAELSNITLYTSSNSLVSVDTATDKNTAQLIFESDIPGKREIKISGDDAMLYAFGLLGDTNTSKMTSSYKVDSNPTVTAGTYHVNGVEIQTDGTESFFDILERLKTENAPGLSIEKVSDTEYMVDVAYSTYDAADTTKDWFVTELSAFGKTDYSEGSSKLNGFVGRDAEVTNISLDDTSSGKVVGFPAGTTYTVEGNKITFTGPNGFKLEVENGGLVGTCELIITNAGALDLQIGANEGQSVVVKIPDMSVKALGLEYLNLRTNKKSEEAIVAIDNAIARVSEVRSNLGAFQNRLDYTINSLTDAEQNLTESLSRIQDTDMADEMTTYTQADILSQAGISILAQANQRPQGLLQLLQNMI